MNAPARPRPLVLCILDGFGERASREDNAVRLANTPALKALEAYPHTLIGTSGPDVGLPPGQMGNSEVGHLNFGAGRIALTDAARIDATLASGNYLHQRAIATTFEDAEMRGCRVHLLGLVSDGGVHSSLQHLHPLVRATEDYNVQVVLHAFLDGRDTPPKSAGKYLAELESMFHDYRAIFGTVSGRYYAMDRDQHWERTRIVQTAIVTPDGVDDAPSALDALFMAYDRGETDEFVAPTRISGYEGLHGEFEGVFGSTEKSGWEWVGDEVGICFNFRADRMRQLCALLTLRNVPPAGMEGALKRSRVNVAAFHQYDLVCMTEYDPKLELRVVFSREEVQGTFGEVISRAGLKQLRCAETEKYAHVTYFFNGGREEPFEGEERKLVPSPRDVPTYDKKPEMSAAAVAREVVAAVKSGAYDFILVNFANPDMVGHTGDLDAAIRAVEAVDAGVGEIVAAVREAGGALLLTSDHGNCEMMKDAEGHPHTAHTTNPVPLYYVNDNDRAARLRDGGRIADIAPTMLDLLGITPPERMTGRSLRDG